MTETRVEKHKIRKHKKKRYLLKFVIFLALCAVAAVVMHTPYFNVAGIAVMGNEEITDEEVVKLSGIELGESIFDVHPILVKRKIKENLYINTVKVQRHLPKEVIITSTEKTAMAQVKMGDRYVVMDIDGTVIELAKESKKATLIENLTVESAARKEKVVVKESEVLEKALALITATQENDLYFKKINIDGKNVDAYIYDKLVCKGKYNDLMSCIETGTLKSVVYDLYQKDQEKGTITVSSNNYCFFTPNQ